MAQSYQKPRKLHSLNMTYTWRMSDCIVGLRFRLIFYILSFLSICLSFHVLLVNIETLCQCFLGNYFLMN